MKIGRIKSEKTPNACHEAASETIPRHDSCHYMKFAKQIGLFLGSALLMLQLVGCCTKPVKSPAWEYRVITRSGVSTDYTSELNLLAKDGWEVVSSQLIHRGNADDLSVVLRRPK